MFAQRPGEISIDFFSSAKHGRVGPRARETFRPAPTTLNSFEYQHDSSWTICRILVKQRHKSVIGIRVLFSAKGRGVLLSNRINHEIEHVRLLTVATAEEKLWI
jgi:hypothetical protein